jgi:hypothetical protein
MGHEHLEHHWNQASNSGKTQHLFVFNYQGSEEHQWGAVVRCFAFIPRRNRVTMKTHSFVTSSELEESNCNYRSYARADEDVFCQRFQFELPMN